MNKKDDNTYAYDDDYEDDNINDESPMKNDSDNDEPDDRNMVGNGQIQNDLVDKEVEQVIMKNTNNPSRGAAGSNQQKPSGGYNLPGDDDEDDGDEDDSDVGLVVNENVNPDDLEN